MEPTTGASTPTSQAAVSCQHSRARTVIIAVVALAIGLGIGFGLSKTHMGKESNGYGYNRDGYGHHMQTAMDGMMRSLEGRRGDAFDRAFLAEMIVHHEGAIAMATAALAATSRPEIKTLAEEIIAAQMKEIEQMRAWQAAWFATP